MSLKQIAFKPGIFAVLFTLMMTGFGFGVILPILPFYAIKLGATPFDLGMLTATFALMGLIFGPFAGKLSDKIGRKKILQAGTLSFVAGYLIFAFTHSLVLAFVGRALEGTAAATVFPACIALLSDYTSDEERGPAMSLVATAFSIGLIVGPAFGGLASGISVQAAFLLAAGMAFVNFLSVHFQVTDLPGRTQADVTSREVSLLEHVKSPMFMLFLASAALAFMFGGLDATLALYTSDKLGFSSPQVGLVFTFIGVLILGSQLASGDLINRFGEGFLIKVGLFFSGLGLLSLMFTHDWLTLLVPLGVFVAGSGATFPAVTSLLTKRAGNNTGAVLGIASSFQSLGQMLGPLLAGFAYGFSPAYAFSSQAIVIWAFLAVFVFFSE